MKSAMAPNPEKPALGNAWGNISAALGAVNGFGAPWQLGADEAEPMPVGRLTGAARASRCPSVPDLRRRAYAQNPHNPQNPSADPVQRAGLRVPMGRR